MLIHNVFNLIQESAIQHGIQVILDSLAVGIKNLASRYIGHPLHHSLNEFYQVLKSPIKYAINDHSTRLANAIDNIKKDLHAPISHDLLDLAEQSKPILDNLEKRKVPGQLTFNELDNILSNPLLTVEQQHKIFNYLQTITLKHRLDSSIDLNFKEFTIPKVLEFIKNRNTKDLIDLIESGDIKKFNNLGINIISHADSIAVAGLYGAATDATIGLAANTAYNKLKDNAIKPISGFHYNNQYDSENIPINTYNIKELPNIEPVITPISEPQIQPNPDVNVDPTNYLGYGAAIGAGIGAYNLYKTLKNKRTKY